MTVSKKKKDYISLSTYRRWMTCAYMDYMHQEGYKPKYTGSALHFGSAVDDAINCLLDGHADAMEAFHSYWTLDKLKNTRWEPIDIDLDLLTPEELDFCVSEIRSMGWTGDDLNELMKELLDRGSKNYFSLSENELDALTLVGYYTGIAKAKLMVEAYKEDILPKIQEVEVVQKEIKLAGGRILGYTDYVATIEGHGRVVIDNKTSSRYYSRDSVVTDPQLALYAKALDCDKAAFVIMLKQIKKNSVYKCKKCGYNKAKSSHKSCPSMKTGERCTGDLEKTVSPEAKIQVVIDNVSDASKEMVEKALLEVFEAKERGFYPKNLSSCKWVYGKPCPYIDHCWKQDNSKIVKEEDE